VSRAPEDALGRVEGRTTRGVGGVRAVLWDADGVLQERPGGWVPPFEVFLGERAEEFLRAAWELERPTLSGQGSWPLLLPGLLEEWGLAGRHEEVLAAWCRLEGYAATQTLVAELRAAGVRCYLATNQDAHRAGVMHAQFEYDGRMDGCFYSHAMGVAKPEPAYFERILAEIGLPAHEVLFIDNSGDNVEGARGVGLRAELWQIGDGDDLLRSAVERHLGS